MKDTEKPIAILTVNDNISKMTAKERQRLQNWLIRQARDIESDYAAYGKCRMRLMKLTKKD